MQSGPAKRANAQTEPDHRNLDRRLTMAETDPTIPLPGTDPVLFARFMAKVDLTEGCWLWTASLDKSGYGNFRIFPAPL